MFPFPWDSGGLCLTSDCDRSDSTLLSGSRLKRGAAPTSYLPCYGEAQATPRRGTELSYQAPRQKLAPAQQPCEQEVSKVDPPAPVNCPGCHHAGCCPNCGFGSQMNNCYFKLLNSRVTCYRAMDNQNFRSLVQLVTLRAGN